MLSLLAAAADDPDPLPYLAVIVSGFAVGVFGHLYKSKLAIATGILLILMGTALFQLRVQP